MKGLVINIMQKFLTIAKTIDYKKFTKKTSLSIVLQQIKIF